MIDKLQMLLTSFYMHNAPVMWYGAMALLALYLQIKKPSRTTLLLAFGFLFNIFTFEYRKHFIPHTESHIIGAIANEGEALFATGSKVVQFYLPLLFDIIGWGAVATAITKLGYHYNKK